MVWAFSRMVWLLCVVLVYRFRIDILSESTQPVIHPILLFLALIICEICPITYMSFSSALFRIDNTPPSVPSHIDLSEEDLFWPLDDSVLESHGSGEPHQSKWIDDIIRNNEALFLEDELPTSEVRPLLLL